MYYLVYTTVSSRKEGVAIIQKILDQRLAACAHLSQKGESFYWWEGNKEHAKELTLTFKTTKKALSRLIKSIKTSHSYKTPEILAVRVEKGHPDYLKWIKRETSR
jgi:periplasmic divalent cation tolerance protein